MQTVSEGRIKIHELNNGKKILLNSFFLVSFKVLTFNVIFVSRIL